MMAATTKWGGEKEMTMTTMVFSSIFTLTVKVVGQGDRGWEVNDDDGV